MRTRANTNTPNTPNTEYVHKWWISIMDIIREPLDHTRNQYTPYIQSHCDIALLRTIACF